MSQGSEERDRFTLHTSVAMRWWLYHLPEADAAARFLYERLSTRRVELVAVDTLPLHVLDAIASDLGSELDTFLAEGLAVDVPALFARLQREGILRFMPHQSLFGAAMLTTSLHGVAFADALAITASQDSNVHCCSPTGRCTRRRKG